MARVYWTPQEETKLRAMYLQGMTAAEIAKQMGRSRASIDNKVSSLGLTNANRQRPERGEISYETCNRKEDDEQLTFDGQTQKPIRRLEDLLEIVKPDLSIWKVDKWECKTWEMGFKDADGEGKSIQLWSYNARFGRKQGWTPKEMLDRIGKVLSKKPKTKHRKVKFPTEGVLCELSIVDHHFGKLAWEPEVGDSYDLKIAEQRYTEAADYLLSRAAERKPDRILYVLGNDFYHVDRGGEGTTTGGTRQDTDGRWQKSYQIGLRCSRDTALKAAEIAPVTIAIVPGNHDEEKMYTLGATLAEVFSDNGKIEVDNAPTLHKGFCWGKVFLGFYHGHNSGEKRRNTIYQEFESCPGYADAAWREIHMGHLHSEHEKVWEYRTSRTLRKTVVRILPSLAGTDKWHRANGYDAPRAAEMHVYDSTKGRIASEVFIP